METLIEVDDERPQPAGRRPSGGLMNRRRSRCSTLLMVVVLSTAACGRGSPTQPSGQISERARAYLEELIGLMQGNSINRLTIDWTMFRASVFGQAVGAQTITDTYPAIRVALGLLRDGHSSFRSSDGTTIFVPNRSCSAPAAGTPTLPGTIGYVKVDEFNGSGAAATGYANSIQRAIMSADRDDVIGWIVDVRGNGGGNMWPMVAGVGPLLGEGVMGYFIDPTGVETAWEYRDGASWIGGIVLVRVDTPYRLRRNGPRVAVLTDNGIASSGEATVIAFRGRPDTRSFGTPTCGLSTANRSFAMSDGASLSLTVSVMADRTRRAYGDSITPDEIVAGSGQVVQRALAWLQTGS